MEKKVFVVTISEEESNEMEKAWYEYNASCDIVARLMKEEGVVFSLLQEYLNVSEARFTKCEMLKQKFAKAYKPDEVNLSKYNYGFDFEEHTITFTEA